MILVKTNLLPMPSLDSTIIAEHTNLAIPADRIIADPQSAARFRHALNRRFPAVLQVGSTLAEASSR